MIENSLLFKSDFANPDYRIDKELDTEENIANAA